MEKTISVEEKIRRAEEIYARRKGENIKQISSVNISKEKKDVKLLKKMIIQLLVCASIYVVIYIIQSNEYVFSKDFTNKLNEVLSYDTNFLELYNNVKNQIKASLSNIQEEEGQNNEEQDKTNHEQKEEQTPEMTNKTESIGGAENTEVLSQTEQDINNVKNTTSFIKPVEGLVSSKYGQRDTATGSVPKNHTGTDIATNIGTKIRSATDGEVVLSSEEGDYGKHLKIQIREVSIIYAHCSKLYVKQGDKVEQGQEIAEVGSTGNSTRTAFTF